MTKFYITTPIYYINSVPTIGSAYTTIAADILSRWHKLNEERVFYLTGLDENSSKTIKAAEKAGYKDIQKYMDEMAKKWKDCWKVLNISYDGFIRTSEDRHKKFVQEFFMKMYKNKDVYKSKYEGYYCDDCEAYLDESDLIEGKCPYHKIKPEFISEENYFFKLSKYQNKILEILKNKKKFLQPKSRRNEIINFIENGLRDISISRQKARCGIEVPTDKSMRFWCWYDALLNYISGSEGNFPQEICLIGKDITRFHSVFFIGFLLSAKYKLPETIFAHGFLTINGQKISKSLGNSIDPIYLCEKYGSDALRYFLIRSIPFGEDGDFSEEALKNRINGELVNELGNLVSRTLTIASKFDGKIEGKAEIKLDLKKINKLMEKYELHNVLNEIWAFIKRINVYINEKEPWKLKGKELGNVLYNLLESIRIISILISPFIPETSEKINKQLGVEKGLLKDCIFRKFSGKVKKGEHLFNKV